MADNELVNDIFFDHKALAEAVELFRGDEASDDERFEAIDIIRAHLDRERDIAKNLAEQPPNFKAIDKIDNWTYEIETMLHDFSDPVYKEAIDGMTAAIEKHLEWDKEVLAPLANKLPADAAHRIYVAHNK